MDARPVVIAEIGPQDLASLVAGAVPPLVIDVREAGELAICALPGALHLPMQEVPARLGEIPRDRALVVLCHHGVRSRMVAEFLVRHGFEDVANLAGGIDAWAEEVDPALPRY